MTFELLMKWNGRMDKKRLERREREGVLDE